MPSPRSSHHHPVFGILLKLGSVALLSSMAACVKYLGRDIPSGETIFVRGLISTALLTFLAWRVGGLRLLKTGAWGLHALRSLSGTTSMFCLYLALTSIPLAELTAITYTAPMFLTVLAMLFLGERIHRYRWTALGLGLLGVLIIIGPQLSVRAGDSVGVAEALAAAVFSALAMTFLRRMSGTGEHAITITFYFSLTATAAAACTAFAGWPMPSPMQWLVIVAAGIFGVLGQLLMTFSYRYAEASTIAPLDYTSLLLALAYGYFLFAETPLITTWVGAPLVVAAGLIILWREYRNLPKPLIPGAASRA